MTRKVVALDIETTGLDPREERVRAVALFGSGVSWVAASDDERKLLRGLNKTILSLPAGVTLVTWNGEEFDLPFLWTRFAHNRISTELWIRPSGRLGKYGKPAVAAGWNGHSHEDIASRFRRWATSRGVAWSLKPVAKEFLGVSPVEVDRSGASISKMPANELRRYVSSDARITYDLARAVLNGSRLTPARRSNRKVS